MEKPEIEYYENPKDIPFPGDLFQVDLKFSKPWLIDFIETSETKSSHFETERWFKHTNSSARKGRLKIFDLKYSYIFSTKETLKSRTWTKLGANYSRPKR